jgi:hypothetical protein
MSPQPVVDFCGLDFVAGNSKKNPKLATRHFNDEEEAYLLNNFPGKEWTP